MDPAAPVVNWLAVVVGAAMTFVIGGLWYSPVLFGKKWQALAGLSDEQVNASNPAAIFGPAFVAALVGSVNLAFFLGGKVSTGEGALYGFAVGFGWVGTSLLTNYRFERKPLGLVAIDAGYWTVSYTLLGLVLAAWV